jgi:hypothetical protein
MAKKMALRSQEVFEFGGFVFFQSPDRAGTADFFLIAVDPPAGSSC